MNRDKFKKGDLVQFAEVAQGVRRTYNAVILSKSKHIYDPDGFLSDTKIIFEDAYNLFVIDTGRVTSRPSTFLKLFNKA